MKQPVVAVFCMPEPGHFALLRSLIAGLVDRGVHVHVFTHRRFEFEVKSLGGVFVDMFGRYPVEGADAESMPVPCRFVTFAGVYADEIVDEVRRLGPSLIVYETFAVIGRLVAVALGRPYVNVSPNHGMDPARMMEALETDPRVSIASCCHQAVKRLRERFGITDASPFSYVSGTSPFLNLYCEPPAYIPDETRKALTPLAFLGSLPPLNMLPSVSGTDGDVFAENERRLRVYACFGTVVWRYYANEAIEAYRAISECVAGMGDACAVISMGGDEFDRDAAKSLAAPNVRVERYVNQWEVLAAADVFITHHGLNSTHEAIYHRVPMISYPFFGDQPALAERCKRLGLTVPLSKSMHGTVTIADVRAALSVIAETFEWRAERLERAREVEQVTVQNRGNVLDRIVELTSTNQSLSGGDTLRSG